jgi:hypothetical protein
MKEKEFDFVIYPLKLIITVGLDYKTLCDRFENAELDHEGEWGDEGDLDSEVSFMNLVRDKGGMIELLSYYGTFKVRMI